MYELTRSLPFGLLQIEYFRLSRKADDRKAEIQTHAVMARTPSLENMTNNP